MFVVFVRQRSSCSRFHFHGTIFPFAGLVFIFTFQFSRKFRHFPPARGGVRVRVHWKVDLDRSMNKPCEARFIYIGKSKGPLGLQVAAFVTWYALKILHRGNFANRVVATPATSCGLKVQLYASVRCDAFHIEPYEARFPSLKATVLPLSAPIFHQKNSILLKGTWFSLIDHV